MDKMGKIKENVSGIETFWMCLLPAQLSPALGAPTCDQALQQRLLVLKHGARALRRSHLVLERLWVADRLVAAWRTCCAL